MEGIPMNQNDFLPDYAIPPSETLKEVLEERQITLRELSKRTKINYETLCDVMNTKKMIDENIARNLEKTLSIPASFWLNLEHHYQETLTRLKKK